MTPLNGNCERKRKTKENPFPVHACTGKNRASDNNTCFPLTLCRNWKRQPLLSHFYFLPQQKTEQTLGKGNRSNINLKQKWKGTKIHRILYKTYGKRHFCNSSLLFQKHITLCSIPKPLKNPTPLLGKGRRLLLPLPLPSAAI